MSSESAALQLLDLACALSNLNNFEEIIRLSADQARSILPARMASVMLLNPKTHQTVKTIIQDGQVDGGAKYKRVQANVCGWVLSHQKKFHTDNLKTDTRFRQNQFDEIDVGSVLCAPLFTEGVMVGCLMLVNKKDDVTFAEGDLVTLQRYCAIVAPHLRNSQKLKDYFASPTPESALRDKYNGVGILGKSPEFIKLIRSIEGAAQCNVRVIIDGETGVGKDAVARSIHAFGGPDSGPFVPIDCGSIPANILEVELFGSKRGAFTGAKDREGLIMTANGGTLFMDEISNLHFDMQAKLLRFLQEGEIRKVGSSKVEKVDVRIIAASSKPLKTMVDEGKFREDLFYRLHVYPIHVPALKERQQDLPLLADHFLKKFAKGQGKKANELHGSLLEFMLQRDWPGNIRELENFIERLVTVASPEMTALDTGILPDDFKAELEKRNNGEPDKANFQQKIAEYESKLILNALIENQWNQSRAARALGLSEGTIRYKIDKLKIKKNKTAR